MTLLTSCVQQLSNLLKVRTVDILKVMIKLGSPPRHSDEYTDKDLVDVIVEQFGRKARRGVRGITDIAPRREPSDEEYAAFPRRAPVVSVMGHIDHGKTTLLGSSIFSVPYIIPLRQSGPYLSVSQLRHDQKFKCCRA
jgi:hypothetical protein